MKLEVLLRVLVAVVALGLVVLVLRDVDLARSLATVLRANFLLLLATLPVQAIALFARLVRWKLQLYPAQNVPLRVLVSPLLVSYAVGNVTVTGGGAPPRIYLLKRHVRLSGSLVAGTIVQEFLLDATFVLFWAAVVPFFVKLPPIFHAFQVVLAVPVTLLLLIDLAMVRRQSLLLGLLKRLGLLDVLIARLPNWAVANLNAFVDGLTIALSRANTFAAVMFTSALIRVVEALIFWLLLQSLDIPFVPAQASAIMAYTNAAIGIFIVPGFAGVLEASSIGLLLSLGANRADALAFTILLRLFFVTPSTVLGAFFAVKEVMKKAGR